MLITSVDVQEVAHFQLVAGSKESSTVHTADYVTVYEIYMIYIYFQHLDYLTLFFRFILGMMC